MIENLPIHDKFVLARWFYAIGEPIYTDAEYTNLLNACKAMDPEDPYVLRSWSSDPCPVELLNSIGRMDAIQKIILSDKTESIESLNTELAVQNVLGLWEGYGTLSYKHDGWNMQASYYNGQLVNIASRGRSSDSMNANILVHIIPNSIPVMGRIKIVMEATIPDANFPAVVQKYGTKDQRASVSTIMAHPEDVGLLQCHAFDIHGYDIPPQMNKFDILRNWGFNVPSNLEIHNYEEMMQGVDFFSDMKDAYESPTDGLVIDAGFKYALRIRGWEEPIYHSFVTGYEESYNRYVITPKLLIYPILREGAEQSRLAITNWERIKNMNLRIGAPVAFRVASSANADVNAVATEALQEEWKDHWDEYKQLVKDEEYTKTKKYRRDVLGIDSDSIFD